MARLHARHRRELARASRVADYKNLEGQLCTRTYSLAFMDDGKILKKVVYKYPSTYSGKMETRDTGWKVYDTYPVEALEEVVKIFTDEGYWLN